VHAVEIANGERQPLVCRCDGAVRYPHQCV
jgi:hypothetical protein